MSCVLSRACSTAVAIAVACLSASACESSLVPFNEVSGSVVTVVDDGSALNSARTFFLPDTIVDVPLRSEVILHDADRQITASIRAHLVALGWREVNAVQQERPDVVVLVAASTRVQAGVAYDNWYGAWGYLPYWDSGVGSSWSWGMPTDEIPYVYQAGTLLIAMLDVRAQNPDTQRIPLLWAAAIDGFVTDAVTTKERTLLGIDQAFAQSSYLKVE
jgi:hypothetical protein